MRTVDEWAVAFNILYNNIASDKAPGLEPYEISRFLTSAQETLVVSMYRGAMGAAFESTEEVTNYLATLVKQETVSEEATETDIYKICDNSHIYKVPKDLLFRTWEGCKLSGSCTDKTVPVIPVTQDEFWRTVRNPFKKQNEQRVLRLVYATDEDTKYTELVSDYDITEYIVRYLSKPSPIILEDLTDTGLEINGETKPMTCKLPEVLHQTILAEAVNAAKAVWKM